MPLAPPASSSPAASFVVELARRAPADDPAGARWVRRAAAAGHALASARLAAVYAFALAPSAGADAPDPDAACARLVATLLADRVLDRATVARAGATDGLFARGAAAPGPGEAVLTVRRRAGVMDPVALSLAQAAAELGLRLADVRAAHRVYVGGPDGAPPDEAGLAWLARALGNPVVDEVLRGPVALPAPPAARPASVARVEVPLAGLDDAALLALSRARTLALDAVEMRAVADHFAALGRAPTDVELETIAQTWSEHCKHKTLTGPIDYEERDAAGAVVRRERVENLLRETIFEATRRLALPRCWSVFEDNAGVVDFDGARGVAVKVETHNHPSALEPYGGAGTGVGGVIRDILGTGLGALPLCNVDVFCVGDLDARPEDLPPGALHPRVVLEGVVAGVRDYGNRMGIPTAAGALVTHPGYAGNPLVFCGTVGLIPRAAVTKGARPGDWLVAVGGRTGRDGVHGATFSSEALTSESEAVSGGAVQIGNPIAEKMLADVLLEVRDRGWMTALTDCGAGGFSSAVGEMAADTGARVDLARAPLKYDGLAPWEVWVSEAQERMVLAVPPERGPDVIALFAAEDVEAVRLGEVTGDGRLVIAWGDVEVGALDLRFLHRGLPRQARAAVWRAPAPAPLDGVWAAPGAARPEAGALLRAVLATPTVGSKAWIVRQYDHEVQGTSALKPLVGVGDGGPQDGVAFAPHADGPDALGGAQAGGDAPRRGVVVGLGLNPRHGLADPWLMALDAVDEALRNCVAAGADLDACAVLDNFSWGDCRLPDRLGGLVRAARGCMDASLAYGVPFISGKDSLNNEVALPDGTRVAIPGTLLVTGVAVVPDVTRLVSMDLKRVGSALVLVGETRCALHGALALEVARGDAGAGGLPPVVDLARAPGVLRATARAIATGHVRAAHDPSEGGLAVALAEMALAGGLGLRVDLAAVPRAGDWPQDAGERDLAALFAESPTRMVLEVDPAGLEAVRAALGEAPHAVVGEVTAAGAAGARVVVTGPGGAAVLDEATVDLAAAWRRPSERWRG